MLFAHEITPTAGFLALSSAAPHSTTAALAGDVPKETPANEDVPGAFPETPAFESGPLRSQEPTFGIAPLPATTGVGNPISLEAGSAVPNVTSNTVDSHVALDREAYEKADSTSVEPTMSVAPLPATTGIGNPISLAPGETVPHHSNFTTNTLDNNITLDKESYERGDATVGGSFAEPAAASSTGMFGVPPVTTGMIPESSLPMGSGAAPVDGADDVLMRSSAAPTSTTAALAGVVPLEPRREATVLDDTEAPAVVQESQMKAHADPEASANPVALDEKNDMESELLSKVPEAPAAADSSSIIPSSHQVTTAIVGGTAAAGAALAGVAVAAKSYMPESIRKSIDDMNASSASRTTAAGVPEPVKESIAESNESPEAAANTAAVVEKKAMERELASVVPVDNSTGEHAPSIGATTTAPTTTATGVPEPVKESIAAAHTSPEAAANPEAVQEKSDMEKELLGAAGTHTGTTGVPTTVKDSIAAAHTSPEAAANPEAVREKSAMEKELESKILPAESSGEPAPAISAATATHAPASSHEGTLAALEGTAVGAGIIGAGAVAASSSSAGPTSASEPLASAAAHTDPNATAVRSRAAPAAATSSSTGPVVTTGIETTPTPAKSTPNPTTPARVTDPAAPVANQGALKAAQQASSSTVSPAAARPSTDSPSAKSDTTDKSAKKKKRFSVFIDKLKDKLK